MLTAHQPSTEYSYEEYSIDEDDLFDEPPSDQPTSPKPLLTAALKARRESCLTQDVTNHVKSGVEETKVELTSGGGVGDGDYGAVNDS